MIPSQVLSPAPEAGITICPFPSAVNLSGGNSVPPATLPVAESTEVP